MADNSENNPEIEALYRRFDGLLRGTSLSEEEKQALSEEMLKIIYGSEEVDQ